MKDFLFNQELKLINAACALEFCSTIFHVILYYSIFNQIIFVDHKSENLWDSILIPKYSRIKCYISGHYLFWKVLELNIKFSKWIYFRIMQTSRLFKSQSCSKSEVFINSQYWYPSSSMCLMAFPFVSCNPSSILIFIKCQTSTSL